MLELTKEEEYKLIEGFGNLWMVKFFNIYHISGFVNKLEKKPELKIKLLKKYEEEWLNNFINKFKKNIVYKKVNYSFGDLVKFQYKIKMGKKLEKVLIEKEDIEELNFSSDTKNLLTTLDISQLGGNNTDNEFINTHMYDYKEIDMDHHGWNNVLVGGNDDTGEDDFDTNDQLDYSESANQDDDDDFDPSNIYPTEIVSDNEDEEIIQTEPSEEQLNGEMNYEEIEKLYQTDETDKNINTTNSLIASVLENSKLVEKKTKLYGKI